MSMATLPGSPCVSCRVVLCVCRVVQFAERVCANVYGLLTHCINATQCRFSDPDFHGKDECLELSPEVLEEMIAHSKETLAAE